MMLAFSVSLGAQVPDFIATVDIEHDGETLELMIPSEYDDLREAYIEMAKLYLGERSDLEQAMEIVADQDRIIDLLTQNTDTLVDVQNDLSGLADDLEREKTETFRQVFLADSFYSVENAGFGGSLGFGVVIFERFQAALKVSFPLSVGLQLAYIW